MQQSDRVAVLGALERIEAELSRIAPWLDDQGYSRASVLAEDAVRSLWACQLLIDRDPDRAKLLAPHGRALNGSGNNV